MVYLLNGHHSQANILVIDRDRAHQRLVGSALKQEGFTNVRRVDEPFEALELAKCQEPDVVLLDGDSEPMDRVKLVSRLNKKPFNFTFIPILLFANPKLSVDRKKLIRAGAYDFLSKPAEQGELALRVRNGLEARSLHYKVLHVDEEIEQKVNERTKELYEAQIEILQRLGRASEYRDDDTGDHTKRVGMMSAKIAVVMGLSQEDVELIRLAAPLHDIGKIGIRDAVLMKPGKLTESEYTVMRTHAIIGSRILEGGSPLLKMAEIIARTHHERWDGTGYPARLSGTNIPLPGRIVAVADVFDALISARSYKAAWPVEKAITEIKAQSGRHFDPLVVEAFLTLMSRQSDSENVPEAA